MLLIQKYLYTYLFYLRSKKLYFMMTMFSIPRKDLVPHATLFKQLIYHLLIVYSKIQGIHSNYPIWNSDYPF